MSIVSMKIAPVSANRINVPRRGRVVTVRAATTASPSGVDVFKMSPMGDRLLVKPKEQETKTAGGLLLASSSPSSNMQEAMVGTVMAIGDEVDVAVKVGDQVLFSKYGSSDVDAEEGKVSFVAQKSILAILS